MAAGDWDVYAGDSVSLEPVPILSSWTKEFIHFIILLLIDTPTGKPLLAATFSNKPR